MAYSELVKKLDHIRSYMRDFYLYGFKSRDDYDLRSLRSYDDEKRRIESWLGEYMGFRRSAEGKFYFISIDSRHAKHNPLYKAFKAKSFTSGDITLHFILFDILAGAKHRLTLSEIIKTADEEYLSCFDSPMVLDESTVRKKLKEYIAEGLIVESSEGKRSLYSLSEDSGVKLQSEMLDFFSEISPLGVVGSFLLDREKASDSPFAFKHHYITSAIDSEPLYRILSAISEERFISLSTLGQKNRVKTLRILPLEIFVSVENGRQYIMAWFPAGKRICSYRIDYILDAELLEKCFDIGTYRARLERDKKHMWGVVSRSREDDLQHIEFSVRVDNGEDYIVNRLYREKRCGNVEMLDENTYRFSADVYDLNEMIPWLRSFISRITDIKMSDEYILAKFKRDIDRMIELYGLGGDEDAFL